MIPWRVRCAHGPADVIQTLTPPAIIAVDNINKELTPEGGFGLDAPLITIRLVNGRLMAKRVFSRI